MAGKKKATPKVENPEADDDTDVEMGAMSGSDPEDPNSDEDGIDSADAEMEEKAALAEAGVSDDLIALRDEIEATLLTGTSRSAAQSQSDDLNDNGIVGVGIGLPDPDNMVIGEGGPGEPVLTLFTKSALPMDDVHGQMAQMASSRALSSVPIQQVPVGVVDAFSHRARQRPAPGGVSVGHVDITAGTLGSRAIGRTSPWNNRHLILSNNHVLADSNDGSVGDSIIQQGDLDGGSSPADRIAILARWVPIRFGGPANYVDAAFGWAWHQRIRGEQYYLRGGRPAFYRTGTAPLAPRLGLTVGKSGRTTALTMGRVTQIGVSVNVNYGGGRIALFRNQMAIRSVNSNPFSQPGDSGSLIWQWASGVRPVGLLFAGGGGTTFANPIASVLSALNIRLLP